MNQYVKMVGFVVLCLSMASQVALAQPMTKPDELKDLKIERQQVAAHWVKSAHYHMWGGGGNDTHLFRELIHAIRAQRDSMLDLAATKEQRVDALKQVFELFENVHEKIAKLHKSESKGGEAVHFYSSKYEMLDAKIKWLEESQRE